MPIQLLISPPATGKTRTCIERIRSLHAENPLAKVWVVLPDRLQTAAFRRRLAEAGGAIGVQVDTFGGLYQEILARAGQPLPLASDPVAQHLVKIAIDDLFRQGGLITYGSIRSMPGFTLALHDRFAELKRALVRPETLLNVTAGGSPGIIELARLYTGYQARLIELGWADPEGLSWLAVAALTADPHLVSDWALLVVDGFDLFIHTQQQALKLLAEQVPDILVTLPGSVELSRPAHRRFSQMLARLKTELTFNLQTLKEKPHLPVHLSYLEKNLFEPIDQTCTQPLENQNQGSDIHFLEGRSPAEEAREALRWIKARIVRDRIPAEDCAIFTPDPQVYNFPLRVAAREFGLPLRFLAGEKLATAPPMAALLDLLKLPLQNFPRRLLLDTIRSPYFELTRYELQPSYADVLDRVSHYGQVIVSLSQWDEVLDRLGAIEPKEDKELDDETALPDLPHGEQARQFKNALHAFADRLTIPARSQPLCAWIGWLEDLLDEMAFLKENANQLEQAARMELGETLRALVLSEAVVGYNLYGYNVNGNNAVVPNGTSPASVQLNSAAGITYQQFISELETALQRATYAVVPQLQDTPRSHPAILVGSYNEGRGVRFQAVALLGLAEGLFPRVERADPFLDEELRQRLGLEPRLGREQAGLFYQAVTRADRCLLLTRPYLADDGESWEASPYWSAAIRLFPGNKPQRVQSDSLRPLIEAASPEETLFWASLQDTMPSAYLPELGSRWDQLQHARRVLQDCQAAAARGPYQGHTPDLEAELRQRYGVNHTWSASRLEAYGTCPYRFFIGESLELEAITPPEPGFNAQQLGSLLHELLKEVYQRAQDPGDLDSVLSILSQVAVQLFKDAPDRFGFRPSLLWKVEQAQLITSLEKTIRGLSELEGDWIPIALERRFGIDATPTLELDIANEHIRLRGIIDRVDQNATGQLRVLDYKTGSSHMTPRDLIEGRRLQLPLYAMAACDALGLGEPIEGYYWAILASKPSSLKLSSFQYENYSGFKGTVDLVRKHIGHSLAGIYQGVFPPQPPGSGCPSYCAAATWCWRYTPER